MIFILLFDLIFAQYASGYYIGSFVYRCHNDIFFTQQNENRVPIISPEIFDSQGNTNFTWSTEPYSNKDCLKSPNDLLNICKKLYGAHLVNGMIHGPSMFPIHHRDAESTELVRPIICVSNPIIKFDIGKSLSKSNPECKMSTLLSSVMFPNSNASFDQVSWESYAKLACDARDATSRSPTSSQRMQLYQINLVKPDMNMFGANRKMAWFGIEFICCPHLDATQMIEDSRADPLWKSVQLVDGFDLYPPVITRKLVMEKPTGPVVGSFIIKCNEFFAYTNPDEHVAARPYQIDELPPHWIHLGKESMSKAINICPLTSDIDSSDTLLETCRTVYHGHEITKAQLGPAMIRYTDQSTRINYNLRPVWCMAKTSFSIVLPTLPKCRQVKELNPIQGADTTCSSQFDLEKKAKTACDLDSGFKLFSAYPRIPCSRKEDQYESLHFVCCPFEAMDFSELSQSLQNKAEDLADATNKQLLIEELHQSYQTMQKLAEEKAKDDFQKLDQKLVFDAAEIETIAVEHRNSARKIADQLMQSAMNDLMAVWSDQESKWSEREASENQEILNRLEMVENMRENDLTQVIAQKTPSPEALQHGLAEVLSALNLKVQELVRELDLIHANQPWRIMPLEWGIRYPNGPAANIRSQAGQPPIWLAKVHSDLLGHAKKATKRINELKKILWSMKPKESDYSRPPNYTDELTDTYNQLQESLKNAQVKLYTLNDLALSRHRPFMERMGSSIPSENTHIPQTVADPNLSDVQPVLTNEAYKTEIEEGIFRRKVSEWDTIHRHLAELLRPYTDNLGAQLPNAMHKKLKAPVRPSPIIIPDPKGDPAAHQSYLMFNEIGETPSHKPVTFKEAFPKILTTAVLVIIPVLLLLFLAILLVRMLAFRKYPRLKYHKRFSSLLGSSASSIDNMTIREKPPSKESARSKLISRVQNRKLGSVSQYQLVPEDLIQPTFSDLAAPPLTQMSQKLNGYENPSFLA